MTIRAILADDEVLARQKLRQLLRDESEVEVVGEGATAAETIELVRATRPDLLFLDIRMPDMDGFDIIGRLSSTADGFVPRIVFTTAYDRYALRAFEIHAVDYLLKPFTPERFRSALQQALNQLRNEKSLPPGSGKKASGVEHLSRIVFKSKGRILFLPVEDICVIGAEENYVRLTTRTESHLLRETMASLEQKLDPAVFLRVHRSTMVNLHFVKEVRLEPAGEYMVVLHSGHKVSMSRTYRSRIKGLS
jgi:two-component system, LytTR family, response regulator